MRDIAELANSLQNLIPDDCEEKFLLLKHKINKHIIGSLPFAPLEKRITNYYWNILQDYVNSFITKEDYDTIEWCKKFINFYLDPTVCNYSEEEEKIINAIIEKEKEKEKKYQLFQQEKNKKQENEKLENEKLENEKLENEKL